jgi:hypothetical protein
MSFEVDTVEFHYNSVRHRTRFCAIYDLIYVFDPVDPLKEPWSRIEEGSSPS